MQSTHHHRPTTTSKALPYFGPVAGRYQNPAAHGGVRYRALCRCGATRDTLVNRDHHERGPWVEPGGQEAAR